MSAELDALGIKFLDPGDVPRAETLLPVLPKLKGITSVLSIGEELRTGWDWWMQMLRGIGVVRFGLVEAWPPNAEKAEATGAFDAVYNCNVVAAGKYPWYFYDLIWWWHGPEHVTALQAGYLFGLWDDSISVILGMPWGKYDNRGHKTLNPHALHVTTYYPEQLQELGFTAATTGPKDIPGGHITAWRE